MTESNLNRRDALKASLAVGVATAITGRSWADNSTSAALAKPAYVGPNIVIIRFGGGTRRRETIDPDHTYSPFFCHEFSKRGTMFPLMEIAEEDGIETGHGQALYPIGQ